MKNIILASASPRRADILSMLKIKYKIMTSDSEDSGLLQESLACVEKAMKLSRMKATDVARQIMQEAKASGDPEGKSYNTLVIGADTIVTFDPDSTDMLEKPKNKDDAFRMLKQLSGRKHYVITGVTVVDLDAGTVDTEYEKTTVQMMELSDEDIFHYISTGEPMDKAGAYGIQGLGCLLVRGVEGCFFNVVGLPVQLTARMLEKRGYKINKNWGPF